MGSTAAQERGNDGVTRVLEREGVRRNLKGIEGKRGAEEK